MFFGKDPKPTSVNEILADLNEKIAQLQRVSENEANRAIQLEEQAKLLKEDAQRSKAEASRATAVMNKISALIS